MALNLPTTGNLAPVRYHLIRQTRHNAIKGGIMQVVDDGPSFWTISYETSGYLSDADYAAWQAWFDSLKGGLLAFNAWARKHPIAYPSGAYPGGFAGVAAVDLANGADLQLKGLPVGFELMPGDLITISGTVDRMHRVLSGGAASGVGELTVTLEPEPHSETAEDDVVTITEPFFTAQISPEIDYGSPVLGRRKIAFSATQRLK